MNNFLIPRFGKTPLDKITEEDIEAWLMSFAVTKTKNLKSGASYSNGTANSALLTLKAMLGEAVRRKLLRANPAACVRQLVKSQRQPKIITPGELEKIFPAQWGGVWENHVVCLINKAAAFTGMRLGELRGLRCEYVYEDHIHVCGQYSRAYGYTETKTHLARNIPIAPGVRRWFDGLLEKNREGGYVFSEDGGRTPVETRLIYKGLNAAFAKIGISEEQRKSRGLSMHGWRHFFNTALRAGNVADSKVQAVTGHLTMQMTDLYTHFDTRAFSEVRAVQESLLRGAAQGSAG
jgi:integrase